MDRPSKFYTPIVLRTGVFYSYSRTVIPYILMNVISYLILLPTGIPYDIVEGVMVSAFIGILIAATWTVRCAVTSFDELFDVFDEDTENGLRLFQSMDRPDVESQQKVKSIFKSEEEYQKFRWRIQQAIFSNKEIYYVIIAVLALVGISIFHFMDPTSYYYHELFVYPWTGIHELFWYFGIVGFLVVFALPALWTIFRFFAIIKIIEESKGTFRVTSYVEYLKGAEHSEAEVMPYHTFFNVVSLIGARVYRITSQAVVTLVVVVMWVVGNSVYNEGFVSLEVWILSIVLIPLTFLVFTSPQWQIHSTLADLKTEVLDATLEEYDRKKLIFTSLIRSKTTSFLTDTESAKLVRPLYDSLLGMQILSSDMEGAPTWTFRMPTALKLVATSLLPIITALAQTYILSFLEALPPP